VNQLYLWPADIAITNFTVSSASMPGLPKVISVGASTASSDALKGFAIPVIVDRIKAYGLTLKLNHPVLYRISYNKEYNAYCAVIQRFNVFALGDSPVEVEEAVKQEFGWLWREYAMAEDNTLAEDAKALKYELLREIEVSAS